MTTESLGNKNPNYSKLKEWKDNHDITDAAIAEKLNISQQYANVLLRSSTMRSDYHNQLLALGFPEDLLPSPLNKQLGRPPKQPQWPVPQASV